VDESYRSKIAYIIYLITDGSKERCQMRQDVMPLALAAKRTALGEQAIRRGIKQGSIDGQKLGRDWYLPVSEVERLARDFPLVDSQGVPA
jgi:hypothetical protein